MISSHHKSISDILTRGAVHPFPARMAPGIALELISTRSESIRVLDPMTRYGTVLAVARQYGHQATGVDIDPLATLIAKVWTTAVEKNEVEYRAVVVLARAKKIATEMSAKEAYPAVADLETKQFLRYWFDAQNRVQLTALSLCISRVKNSKIRDVLWCAFSRLIISKQSGASLAMDLSHSRPHKVFSRAPIKPFDKFLSMVNLVVRNCISHDRYNRGPATRIILGDARALPLEATSIDLTLTSPPYLNAIDYIRCSKFSLVWMGHNVDSLRLLRSSSVGCEVGQKEERGVVVAEKVLKKLRLNSKLTSRKISILRRFVNDMYISISEVERVLKPSGNAVYVVGENTIEGVYIRNSKIVEEVAKSVGLSLIDRRSRTLPANKRYMPAPESTKWKNQSTMNVRMRKEVVLGFEK